MANATDAKFAEYLDWIVEGMGMDSSRSSPADVIEALRAIPLIEQA
ncbi:MAG: hypothetical protein ABI147_12175 [Acidobacteriaceae bacterium]